MELSLCMYMFHVDSLVIHWWWQVHRLPRGCQQLTGKGFPWTERHVWMVWLQWCEDHSRLQ